MIFDTKKFLPASWPIQGTTLLSYKILTDNKNGYLFDEYCNFEDLRERGFEERFVRHNCQALKKQWLTIRLWEP
jgi:hypothetical protein